MRMIFDWIGAIWVLISLAWVTKLRFGGRYWQWRLSTAFPDGGHPAGMRGMIVDGLGYARWAWRMRSMR